MAALKAMVWTSALWGVGVAMWSRPEPPPPAPPPVVAQDQFNERWPAEAPAPQQCEIAPQFLTAANLAPEVEPPTLRKRERHARAAFVCKRQTFYRGKHRYWSCKR